MLFPEVFGRNNFDAFDDFFNGPFDRQFDRPHRMPPHPPVQVMKTDVKETDTGYELAVDLPGVKKENVKAELNDGYLTISATTEENNDQQDENGKYIPLKDIAARQELSKKYLEIIVKDMVAGGLLVGASGKGGGYKLCRKPEEYSIGEIIELMEDADDV